jgi:ADP-heptose:LPS heptosyltransferase
MKSILIVLMGSIGDVTRGFSVLDPIKKFAPDVRITWLVEPKCEGLVRLHPLIDRVIVFNRKRGMRAISSLRNELQSDQYDVVLDMQRHFKSGFFSWLANGKRSIGFHPQNTKEFNHWFHKEYINYFPESVSKITNYQDFVASIGIEPARGNYVFGLEGFKGGRYPELPVARKYIGIVLGSSWPSKDIPKDTYLGLIRRLLVDFSDSLLVLFGDKTHVTLAQEICNTIKDDSIFSSAGQTDLGGLCTLLSMCDCVVGPDSGPGHICSAVGTSYVACFGPTNPARVAPVGMEDLVVTTDIGCAPCWRRECPGLDNLCMRRVSFDAIVSKMSPLLQ